MKLKRIILLIILIALFITTFIYNFYLFKYKDVYEETSQKIKIGLYMLFLFFLSTVFALLEIQIEGKHGWAQNLPTWVYKKDWIINLLNGKYPTGYHTVFILLFFPLFFHLPVFFTKWSIYKECIVIGSFFLLIVVEDFMWFVLNPAFGLKKFSPKNKKIWWHRKWFWKLPDFYIEGLLVAFILLSAGLPYL